MRQIRRMLIVAAGGGLLGWAVPATAQSDAAIIGQVDATVYEQLASRAGYLIRRPDSTVLSRDIAAILQAELARRQISTDAAAGYILSFRFGSDPTVLVDRAPDVELRGSLGSSGNEDLDDLEVVLRTQLFDPPSRPNDIQTRILSLTVTDRENRLVWQGRAKASGAAADDLTIARVLAPHLIDRIGTAAYQERVQ